MSWLLKCLSSLIHVLCRIVKNVTGIYAAYGVYDVVSAEFREKMLAGMCGFNKDIEIEDNKWASKVGYL